MKPNRQAKRYAEALLNVSIELDCVIDTGKSLLLIDKLISHEKVFRAFFYTKRIEPTKKVEILKSVLGVVYVPPVVLKRPLPWIHCKVSEIFQTEQLKI